jgi:hypothetical protein
MKKIIFWFICLFAFSATNMAQKEAIRRQSFGTVPVDKAVDRIVNSLIVFQNTSMCVQDLLLINPLTVM